MSDPLEQEISRIESERARLGRKPRSREEQRRLIEFHNQIGQSLVDNLNRNVLKDQAAAE